MYLFALHAFLIASLLTSTLADQGLVGVYVCPSPDWTGNCGYGEAVVGGCWDHKADPVTGFGPDVDLACTIFDRWGCVGDSLPIQWPGISDLGTVVSDDQGQNLGAGWAGRLQSFSCVFKYNPQSAVETKVKLPTAAEWMPTPTSMAWPNVVESTAADADIDGETFDLHQDTLPDRSTSAASAIHPALDKHKRERADGLDVADARQRVLIH